MVEHLSDGLIVIEPIAPLTQLETEATAEELELVQGITAPSRRAERLAWLRVLRKVLGEKYRIGYTEQGAPRIFDSEYNHISVSHCRDKVAVMLCQRPCGIDIELANRDFQRIASRYINPRESSLGRCDDWQAILWCAKEALYKMRQRVGINFLSDVEILSHDNSAQQMEARIDHLQGLIVRYRRIDKNHILAYLC